ncbi:hypothetical protein [Algoriphagus hitonicola]|uniref:Uncharacterized protein n=1 Tax=Algoriphagus hitonicola TaxID=435880 RepID=A0A1I2P9H6_9BACT|nr:hypothetical protein [Algoriphagus hitonicola]SFG10607.1 hypothetical protein SAMN04487988_101430 [Algoriphagus hitonicola]
MKLQITDQMVREIAEDLDAGMTCYVDKNTGEIESLPDTLSPYFDSELWQDLIDKIDRNMGEYWIIEPMESWEAFQVMDDFVDSLGDNKETRRLISSLQHPKPF